MGRKEIGPTISGCYLCVGRKEIGPTISCCYLCVGRKEIGPTISCCYLCVGRKEIGPAISCCYLCVGRKEIRDFWRSLQFDPTHEGVRPMAIGQYGLCQGEFFGTIFALMAYGVKL